MEVYPSQTLEECPSDFHVMTKFTLSLLLFSFSLFSCSQESNVKKVEVQNQLTANDTIVLGGGCYWCVEAVYERLDGVVEVVSGYSGGKNENPSYEQVCGGKTGHAEVIRIAFDSTKTSILEILKVFFTVHDPTTLNRQGADVGTQYRSVIFYSSLKQKTIAEELISALNKEKVYTSKIVTEVSSLGVFYIAEDYHQDYYERNKEQGYCRMVIQPKIEKFEKVFGERMKN
jgi:methionine-S-sulfoxide reductase